MKMTLGAFIAHLRKEKALTQKQLSEILGVSDKTVSHWEREESAPDISILPLLADTLGVTVDELLAGERKTTETPVITIPEFIPNPVTDKIKNGYRMFKIANVIAAAISLFSTIISSGALYFYRFMTRNATSNYFSLLSTVISVFVSAVLTVIFNLIFTTKLDNTSDEHNRYRFIANRISTLNIYLGIVCISANLVFSGRYGFIFVAIAMVLCLILELALKNNALSIDKAFENDNKKTIYFLRKSCATLCAILVIIGSCGHFYVSEIWYPSEVDKVIYSADEFKEYMETPTFKPEDIYIVEEMTTAPPTTAPAISPEIQSPVVTITPNQNTDNLKTETVYDNNGNEVVTFTYANKAVYDYAYNHEEHSFHIITYGSKSRAEAIDRFRHYNLDFLMPLYYAIAIAISLIVYKKKKNNI